MRVTSGMAGDLVPPAEGSVIMKRSKQILAWALVAAVIASAGLARDARAAFVACTAGEIIAKDPSCPASGDCIISKDFDISDGCVIDFGTRNIVVAASSKITIGASLVTFLVGDFIVAPGATIDGRTSDVGGFLTVVASGDVEVLKSGGSKGKILVSGDEAGGNVLFEAGGDITIDSQLYAHNRDVGTGEGGVITLRAMGDIWITTEGDVDLHGGPQAVGGYLELEAGGLVRIDSSIDLTGGEGGSLSIVAGATTEVLTASSANVVINEKINTTGLGDAGSGGDVDIFALGDVEIIGEIQDHGTGSPTGFGGGDGGAVFVESVFGSITVESEINARGGTPDGGGGDVEMLARGSINIVSTGKAVVESTGLEGWGGEVLLNAGLDVTIDGEIQAKGGAGEGVIAIDAGRDVSISGAVNASGTEPGSFGGSVTVLAGLSSAGDLTLGGTLDVSGTGCDEWGCSLAGDVEIVACDITVQTLALIDARAPTTEGNGGTVSLIGRDQITISGTLDATGGGGFLDGSNRITHPIGTPPNVTGSILPEEVLNPMVVCTGDGSDPPLCLVPCPVCGDGITEFPETCDNSVGAPVSCDGCSALCRIESCDDGNDCTEDTCDSDLGCLNLALPDGTSCTDDGDACTTGDTCSGGLCAGGAPLDCDDGNMCTDDSCDPASGCVNQDNSVSCDDGDACTTDDTCSGGACVGGTPLDCDDGDMCTDDSCSPASGCVHQNNAASCDDGDACTTGDTCSGGSCTGGAPLDCDDGNECTNDSCSPASGCVHQNNTASCDDGDVCTTDDTCSGGSCAGETLLDCDDGDVCTDDSCDSTGGCVNTNNTASCDDGDACTMGDTCSGGSCVGGTPTSCDDGNECTDDSCNPASGCVNTNNTASCDDGDACTTGDTCSGGSCVSGAPRDCDDGNICTDDSCDPVGGCVNRDNTVSCDDGNTCTTDDTCSGGSCAGGTPLDCDDGNECTDDSCDPVSGCVNQDNTASCDDANACTTDSCDEITGCMNTPNETVCPLQMVTAKKLSVKVKATKPKKNRIVSTFKGAFDLPRASDDPTIAGATLRIRDSRGQDLEFSLPATGWKARGNKGFSYKNGKPCNKVTVKAGKLIKAECKGEGIGLELPLSEPVQVILRMGDTSYCAAFGGSTAKKSDSLFVAKGAVGPVTCSSAFYPLGSVPEEF